MPSVSSPSRRVPARHPLFLALASVRAGWRSGAEQVGFLTYADLSTPRALTLGDRQPAAPPAGTPQPGGGHAMARTFTWRDRTAVGALVALAVLGLAACSANAGPSS